MSELFNKIEHTWEPGFLCEVGLTGEYVFIGETDINMDKAKALYEWLGRAMAGARGSGRYCSTCHRMLSNLEPSGE